MSHSFVDVITPKTSRAKHLGYILPNGVKCIIIHDPSAKMPAAAMCIHAGQLNDPECLPGLAHFCEHMLFMGTAKFEKEDEYHSYISKHNGFCNAFTADCDTVYYFQVSDEGFEGALNRFLEFFVAPSFNASAVGREVQAVHSEDEKNHSVDEWRVDELFRTLHNQKHPRYRYGNGNVTTLVEEPKQMNTDLREELQKFYSKYYLSGASCIVVYSAFTPLDVLKLIETPLMNMRVGGPPSFHFLEDGDTLFEKSLAPSWVNIQTLKKSRQLHICWPVLSSVKLWKSVPSSYISYVLGHECNNSVFGVLKSRGLATSMVAGTRRVDDDFEYFYVEVALTLKGFRHINEIIVLIYQCIGQSIQAGIQKSVYEQIKNEERLRFESCEVNSPTSHCIGLAMAGLICDLKHAWIGCQVVLEDNYEECLNYARQLTPKNSIIFLKWSGFPASDEVKADKNGFTAVPSAEEEVEEEEAPVQTEGEDATPAEDLFRCLPIFAQHMVDKVTRFHKATYSRMPIPNADIDAWMQALQPPYPEELGLPTSNPYLTTDFTVFPPESDEPAKPVSYSFQNGTVVVRKDNVHHNTFTCAIRLVTLSPVSYKSPLNRMYMQVACFILKDVLTELSYYGELASLSNNLVAGPGGIDVTICGPYQHIIRFFHDILAKLFDAEALEGTSDKYCNYAEQYLRKLQSRKTSQPFQLCLEKLSKISSYLLFTFEDILEVASSASYDGYKAFISQYLGAGFLFECFVAGNVPSAEGIKHVLANEIEMTLSGLPSSVPSAESIPRFRDSLDLTSNAESPPFGIVTTLDVVAYPPFTCSDPNVVVTLNICTGVATARTTVLTKMAAKLLSSRFFDALRTKEILGYVVFCHARITEMSAHVIFSVQSALEDVDSLYLLSRIIAFLSAVENNLDHICGEDDFKDIKTGLIQSLEKLPDSVYCDAESLEDDYRSASGLDNKAEQIDAIKSITLDALKEFFHCYLLNRRTNACGLVVIVDSARCAAENPFNTEGAAGRKFALKLPPKRTGSTDETPKELTEGDLVLPAFEEGTAHVEVHCIDTIASYRQDRPVLRSHTF
ncbi:unnamed protein product [Phytomonas sp. EM1]|nr:unnamed protein product [Phytomonas sp. EM1]|eukprot:CCW65725.1 unnamed protein product [Phytomonas sp. isolate EM1]